MAKGLLITNPEVTTEKLHALLKERLSAKAGLKISILLLALNSDLSVDEISRFLGFSRQFIYQIIWKVNENGIDQLK